MSLEAADAKWRLALGLGSHRAAFPGKCMIRSGYVAAVLMGGLFIGCAAADDLDDGKPVHNPGIVAQRDGDGLPLLPKLHWEMRREQIQLAYPGMQELWIARGGSEKPNFRQLKIPHFMIAGCEFWLDLDFFNPPEDTLTELGGYYDGPDVEGCLQRVRTKFFDIFGPHPWNSGDETTVTVYPYKTSEQTETTVSRAWIGKVTMITFDVTTILKTGKHRFRFTLLHNGAPGTFVE